MTLESAAFPDGRIYATSSGYIPRYFIKDHLGSVRVEAEFISNGIEVTARHDYYPFGLRVDGGLLNAQSRFLYNGKEKQVVGGLNNLLDYGARMKNGIRFNNPDPLAEKYYSISPYAYCANNPIRFIDPTGMIQTDCFFETETKIQTQYRTERGELLFETNDGLTDIIIIPDKKIKEFEEKLNKLDEEGKINDPKANKEELHGLGIAIESLKDLVLTGGSSVDVGIERGYSEAYNSTKTALLIKIGRIILGIEDENALINCGYVRGKAWGKADREAGRINKLDPYSSLKSNKPLINLKNNNNKK